MADFVGSHVPRPVAWRCPHTLVQGSPKDAEQGRMRLPTIQSGLCLLFTLVHRGVRIPAGDAG